MPDLITDVLPGKIYKSRAFPHISRKVMGINKLGIVYYQIIDAREPNAPWRRMASAPLNEFAKVSTEVVNG